MFLVVSVNLFTGRKSIFQDARQPYPTMQSMSSQTHKIVNDDNIGIGGLT